VPTLAPIDAGQSLVDARVAHAFADVALQALGRLVEHAASLEDLAQPLPGDDLLVAVTVAEEA
jgi:hypothetical protein